jgi:hypothetical protein
MAAVNLLALPGMAALRIGADPAIGRTRVMTKVARTAQGPAKAAARAPISQLLAAATVEAADRGRPSLGASECTDPQATSEPVGGAQVVRSVMATRIGHLGRVVTAGSVRAASRTVRDGQAATRAVTAIRVGALATATGARVTAAAG